jgi:hypothetical protein
MDARRNPALSASFFRLPGRVELHGAAAMQQIHAVPTD